LYSFFDNPSCWRMVPSIDRLVKTLINPVTVGVCLRRTPWSVLYVPSGHAAA
jgi:hypothetical protein